MIEYEIILTEDVCPFNADQAIQVTYFKKRRVMEYQRDLTIKKLSAQGVQGQP